MALGQFAQPAQAGGNRGPILQAYVYPGQAVPMTDNGGGTGGFVDQVVQASAAAPAQPQMLAQQYHLLNAVRLRYYHLLALQRLIAVREELASVTRDAVTAIDGMAAAGQATKAELLQARVEAREQMAALQNARAVYQSVWVRLAASVGQPELPFGSVAGDLEQAAALPALEAAWTHVAAVSPEMQMVRAEVVRRQTTLRQTLGGSNGKSCGCDKSGSDNVLAQAFARMSEPFTGVDPQVKQAAWADLSRCEAEIGRVEQSLRQRLADAYARCDRAREVCELYRTQNLPDAKEAYELSVLGYRQGRGSWPQVQIAQRNYFRMSTEYVEALAELRRSELVILGLLMDGPEEAMPQPAVKQAAYRR
jgi:outer membrane protein TolC